MKGHNWGKCDKCGKVHIGPGNKGKRGVQSAWNKGLTKATDIRVAQIAKNTSSNSKQMWIRKRAYIIQRQNAGKKKSLHYPWNKGLSLDEIRRIQHIDKFIHSGVQRLEEHWNWKGGVSRGLYAIDFSFKLKEKIRKRAGMCVLCGVLRGEHSNESGEDLCVHHVNGVKTESSERNLVALCRSCHAQLHDSCDVLPNLMGMW